MIRAGICGTVLFLWMMTGCVRMGADLSIEKIHAVTPGQTTKSQLFDLLGVSPNAAGPDDTAYTLFPLAGEYDRVHFFESSYSYSYPLPFFIYWGANYITETDRLWALVNEKTGIVQDFAFKQYEQPVVFGRPRFPNLRSGEQ